MIPARRVFLPGSVASGAVPRVRTQASEVASETAFALLDALWHGPVGIGVIDRDLRFQQVNEALARAHGCPAADHAGRTVRDVLSGAGAEPEAIAAVEDAARAVLETGRPRLNVPKRTAAADGRIREWLVSYFP